MLARLLMPRPITRLQWTIGLGVSLLFAFIYGYLAMVKGFSADYVVQDDARHYLFWMDRFQKGDAFPNDLIADYLQSIAPVGYKLLYRLASYSQIAPEWLAKVLPMVLGTVAAGYYYCLILAIFPVPMAGVMGTVMLSQHLWCTDDLVSASPRSFIYPLMIALLFYFVRQRWGVSFVCLGLLTLFYPPLALVATTLYAVHALDWSSLDKTWRRPWRLIVPSRARLAIAAIAITILGILPTYFVSQQFDPVVTMAQAYAIPEFQPSGRHSFFRAGISRYWLVLYGGHGAILKRTIFTPITLVAALFLLPMARYRRWFPALNAVKPCLWIFAKLTLAAMVWFVAAYGVAFQLHMPGRYTSHCILLAVPILAAIAWIALLSSPLLPKRWSAIAALVILVPLFFYYPLLLKKFPKTLYMTGHEGPIYEYLQTQPQDTLVASLDYEADNIPTFAKRSILIAPEYGTPFHLGYYRQIRQRADDLLRAHYTRNINVLKTFDRQYGVDFWLINKAAFTPGYLAHHRYWANNYQPLVQTVANEIDHGSILQSKLAQCTTAQTDRFWLMSADCVLQK